MDPSALIFVALAVAWAGYLIPKALEHHEESSRTRTIDKFSQGLRILARREPRSRRTSELVTVADAPPPPPPPALVPAVLTAAQQRARRRAFAAAARRRRRILDLLFVANVGVAAAAILQYAAWTWMAAPAGVVLVWLIASRRAAVRERRTPMVQAPSPEVADVQVEATPHADVDPDYFTTGSTGVLETVEAAMPFDPNVPVQDPDGWEMLPFVIPTYVGKAPAARRSVRTIDLDSTGVWSAGRNAADSALVRDADAAATARAQERESDDGHAAASGS